MLKKESIKKNIKFKIDRGLEKGVNKEPFRELIAKEFLNQSSLLGYNVRGDERFEITLKEEEPAKGFAGTFSHKEPLLSDIRLTPAKGNLPHQVRAEITHYVHFLKMLQLGHYNPSSEFFGEGRGKKIKEFMKKLPKDLVGKVKFPASVELGGAYALTEAIDELSHLNPEQVKEATEWKRLPLERWRSGKDDKLYTLTLLGLSSGGEFDKVKKIPLAPGFLAMQMLGRFGGHSSAELIKTSVAKKTMDFLKRDQIKEDEIIPTVHKFRRLLSSLNLSRPDLDEKKVRNYISLQRLALASAYRPHFNQARESKKILKYIKKELKSVLRRSPGEHRYLQKYLEKVESLSEDIKDPSKFSEKEEDIKKFNSELYEDIIPKIGSLFNELKFRGANENDVDHDATTYFVRKKLLGLANTDELDNAIRHLEEGNPVSGIIATEKPLNEEQMKKLEESDQQKREALSFMQEELNKVYSNPAKYTDFADGTKSGLKDSDPHVRATHLVALAKHTNPEAINEAHIGDITKSVLDLLEDQSRVCSKNFITPTIVWESARKVNIQNWAHYALVNLGTTSVHKSKVVDKMISELNEKENPIEKKKYLLSALNSIRASLALEEKKEDFDLIRKINDSIDKLKANPALKSACDEAMKSMEYIPKRARKLF